MCLDYNPKSQIINYVSFNTRFNPKHIGQKHDKFQQYIKINLFD